MDNNLRIYHRSYILRKVSLVSCSLLLLLFLWELAELSAEESHATAVLGWVNIAVSDGLNFGLLLGEHGLLGGENGGLVGKNGLLGSDNILLGDESGLLILELFLLILGFFLIVLALIVSGGDWCGNNFESRWGSVSLESAELQCGG